MSPRGLAIAALLAARLVPRAAVHGGPTVCPFRLLTGRPCPTCGITRSWTAATRLDVSESLAWHPLGIPTVLGAAALATGLAPKSMDGATGRRAAMVWTGLWLAVWIPRLVRPPARLHGRRTKP